MPLVSNSSSGLPLRRAGAGIHFALLQEQDARAVRRGDGRMSGAELDGRVAVEVDEEDLVLDPCGNLRGVRCGLVRILGVAAQHVQQRVALRDKGQLADIQPIVGAVARERADLEPIRAGPGFREPHVAPAPGIAHPGHGTSVWRGDNVGRERRAEDLFEAESCGIGGPRGAGQQDECGGGKQSGR